MPQPTIENWRALMALAIENDDHIYYLAAKVCEYNLRLVEGLNDEQD